MPQYIWYSGYNGRYNVTLHTPDDPLPRAFYYYDGEIVEGNPCIECKQRVECLMFPSDSIRPCAGSDDERELEFWIEVPDDEDIWELVEKLRHDPDFEEKYLDNHRIVMLHWVE